ncbi:multiple C2 domain and transmembrane region protein [Arctopsyche grandis]|uniref:multiple C2 domain and transmembrane region protein n=1 Tax=Arctopsyche grandis TaxID=121162 RepID=UPI00406D77AA
MSTKKGSPTLGRPRATDGVQLGRLSRSASELSSAGASGSNPGPGPPSGPPRARSAQTPRRSGAPLSVLNKTHSFFNTLRSRWHRSRSKERPARDGSAGSSTEYAADQSSEHSSSATPSTQSPRHRIHNNVQDSPLVRSCPDPSERPPTPLPAPAHLDLLPTMDEALKREQQLRQFSFFQLRIHLKRGQNLVAMDKNGTSDPYVKFKVGGRLLYKSRTIYRDLNPVWDESFTVPIEDPFQAVHIKVFDYDWGLQDDFMGSCYLDLTALELGRSQDLVLCLQDANKSGTTMHDLGEVVLNATLWPRTQEDKEQYFQRSTRLCDINKRLKCQIWSSVVTIVLVEAKGLTAMDQDTGSSDPYVKFRLGNEKYKSKVIWRSLNPCWLEQFDLHLYDDQEQLLELTVWDRDKQSKDDFLGRCVIDLSLLEREKTHNIWKNLEDGNGQVFLLLTISGTTSSETITDLTNYQDNPKERSILENKYVSIVALFECGGVGWLCVKVFGAKGLAAADLGGKSDPFCVLELINARLQTHTEYKTLAPNWMKIFTFNVKDITSVLEITVYDEDHDHKVEFLGKLSLPLLNIKNGDKRWYSLKDKKMRARAKGNCPQILLEMTVIWNPIKACVRAINPREEKYMQTEVKFKRQVFLRNVIRLKSIIMWFIEIGKILQACFEWESRLRSFVALVGWIILCYYFEPWMAPCLLLLLFGRNWLIFWITGGSYLQQPIDDEELLAEEDEDDPEQDKEEKKSLKERLQAIQEVTQSVQNSIGYMASLGEEVKNLFNFTVPYLSWIAVILLILASFVLFLIPVRYLLMLWGINKFARKILRPHTIPNNEVLDLLSRIPDDEELLDFRELKTHPTTEARRDARKKHKAS